MAAVSPAQPLPIMMTLCTFVSLVLHWMTLLDCAIPREKPLILAPLSNAASEKPPEQMDASRPGSVCSGVKTVSKDAVCFTFGLGRYCLVVTPRKERRSSGDACHGNLRGAG